MSDDASATAGPGRSTPVVATLLCAVLLGGLANCRKASAPEYYAAEADYEVLVLRLGDDAMRDRFRRRAQVPVLAGAGHARAAGCGSWPRW